MVSDACFGGVPTVLSGGRGRQMPFDVRCSGYERDIVQVDDLPLGSAALWNIRGKKRMKHLQLQVKLWLEEYQPVVLDGCVMTDPAILRYCGKYSQLMHHPKHCTKRHCRFNRSGTHQKHSASLEVLLISTHESSARQRHPTRETGLYFRKEHPRRGRLSW